MLLGLLVVFSYLFLDKEIALSIDKVLFSDARFSFLSSELPDLLTPLVCAIAVIALGAYLVRERKGVYDKHTLFLLLIACSVTLVFFLKSVLQFVVGRINTRFWLINPGIEEFHWFDGEAGFSSSFPSGHMSVFSVIVIALWKFYPRYRIAYGGSLSALALALIVTEYHFLSDIIAGLCLGLLVYYATRRGLRLLPDFQKTDDTL